MRMGLLLLVLIPAVIALVALGRADDRSEEFLYLKLFGHALLGSFTFNLNQTRLPVGFPIALLMAANAPRNKGARRLASTLSFVLWLLTLLFF